MKLTNTNIRSLLSKQDDQLESEFTPDAIRQLLQAVTAANEVRQEQDAYITLLEQQIEWIKQLVQGKPVSDFALSFPLIHDVACLQAYKEIYETNHEESAA